MDSADQQAITCGVIQELGLEFGALWLAHMALGGDASEEQLVNYCRGTGYLPAHNRDAVSQAVNEWDSGQAVVLRAPYSFSPMTL
ncbi:MAG TPA: hypothetical protein VJ617_01200 [Arthrobacter sp.]|nr:hypothetical protein [Arthrobacter sp.]